MYPAFGWRFRLLALMRYAACLSLETPRPHRAHSANRFQARRFDCSFIFTRPLQTLVGELEVALLCHDSVRNCAVILPG
jgi:hypothetical protein